MAQSVKCLSHKQEVLAGQWWRRPLIPALGDRGRQLYELEASLGYRVSSKTGRTVTQRNPVLKNQNKMNKHIKKKPRGTGFDPQHLKETRCGGTHP